MSVPGRTRISDLLWSRLDRHTLSTESIAVAAPVQSGLEHQAVSLATRTRKSQVASWCLLCPFGQPVSNVIVDQPKGLWKDVRVRPRFVQNRCYTIRGWHRQVRQFCKVNGLVYQGLSLLTANLQTLAAPEFAQVAARHRRTAPAYDPSDRLQVRAGCRHDSTDGNRRRRAHAGESCGLPSSSAAHKVAGSSHGSEVPGGESMF